MVLMSGEVALPAQGWIPDVPGSKGYVQKEPRFAIYVHGAPGVAVIPKCMNGSTKTAEPVAGRSLPRPKFGFWMSRGPMGMFKKKPDFQ